ncbi:MAG TPA: HlyD family efflux transporter periplasmic adaptor subunit, partial [Pirellulaceae bacterium]|nr:HlyD family efflux transporter periplasmic adaptor subunit [Pirellulaceae bacterium]
RRESAGATPAAGEGVAGPDSLDQKLVHETRNQIRALVEEIAELSQANCDKIEFYEGFLMRCTQAMASIGGAIWEIEDGSITLQYQINLARTQLVDEETRNAHSRLISRKLVEGEACLVAANSGGEAAGQQANPTDHLLVLAPLKVNQRIVGIVEIFQRTDSGPATQRGYLRFLEQMSAHANTYLSSYQLRQYEERQRLWLTLDQFVRNVHLSLSLNETAFAIANEGRRVIDCDRVSLAMIRGGKMQTQVVSGLDSIERRADQIKRLNRLIQEVTRAQHPLWYAGDDTQLPPQIERCLHDYVDLAHSKVVGIIPLRKRELPKLKRNEATVNEQTPPGAVFAALVIEKLADESMPASLIKRTEAVADHASLALTNATAHNSILFAPLWQWLGQCSVIVSARNLPKTLLISAVLITAILAMCFVPYPFTLGSSGNLTPTTTHKIFALTDGTLTELHVPDDPDEIVQPNQLLAVLANPDLQREIQSLEGEINQTIEQIDKYNRIQTTASDQLEASRIMGDRAEAQERLLSLQEQVKLKKVEAQNLQVFAPHAGRIIDWKLRENLLRRPISRGQNLMTLVDPQTDWHIELELPERRTVHLFEALKQPAALEQIVVTFTLASYPGTTFTGKIIEIDRRLDVHSENNNTLKLIVAFDKSLIPRDLLREGTRVNAKVEVGKRSIGYVWLHELFETIQSQLMFWL